MLTPSNIETRSLSTSEKLNKKKKIIVKFQNYCHLTGFDSAS